MPGEGKQGYGMTLGREAVMPGEGKQGNGMTLGREAVMPGEGKQGNGMTFGRKAVMPGEEKQGNGMTFGEKGNQYARSFPNRLPLKQACLPRGSQKRRPRRSRLLLSHWRSRKGNAVY